MTRMKPASPLTRTLFGSLRAEITVLGRATGIRICAAALLFLVILVFYSSSEPAWADVSRGFYFDQAFVLLGLYGSLLTAIAGAFVGGKDHEWRTRPWRFAVDGRKALLSARLILLALLSLVCVIVCAGLGGLLDAMGGHGSHGAGALAARMGYVWGVMVFWGLVGFVVSSLSRSFAWGVAAPFVWVVLEPLVDFYLPAGIAGILPMWNIKIILRSLFPNQDGTLAVILPAPGSSAGSGMIFAIYLAVALGLSCVAGLRRDR